MSGLAFCRLLGASLARDVSAPAGDDSTIRDNILTAIAKQDWAPHVNVIVKDGLAELRGIISDDRQRQALVVATENVPGVKKVLDHLDWVEPMPRV